MGILSIRRNKTVTTNRVRKYLFLDKASSIMDPIKKEDVKQEVFDLYDDYAHSRLTRRDFVERLSIYAVGV